MKAFLLITVSLLALFLSVSAYKKDGLHYIDFDTSMGRDDSYLRPYYKQLLKRIDDNDDSWFRYFNQDISAISMLNRLKQNYYLSTLSKGPTQGVPKIVHQIWVGDRPLPKKYKKWQKTWQSIPGWSYKLWTDKEAETLTLINRKLYDEETNMGARSDILRLEILYKEGGVYVDTDFECLKPELLDVLNNTHDFYCGLQPIDYSVLVINNAIIGSVPGHPIIKACIDNLPYQKTTLHEPNAKIVANGPGLFTRMTLHYMNKGYSDMIFPPTFFYPLGARQLKTKPYVKMAADDTHEEIKNVVVKPESIAIHWWDASWAEPNANISSAQ